MAELDDTEIVLDDSFDACGVEIKPLRLLHGGTYLSLGFVFGSPGYVASRATTRCF